MTINKTLKRSEDLYLQFTDEEVKQLNLEPNQKFSVITHDDGSFELRKFVPVEIDLSDWSRETLEMIISKSLDEDITVNEVINNVLREALPLMENVDYKSAEIDPNFTNNDTSITGND
jgi:hypothetical protein